ncbi:MAG: hypothetical protein GY941_16045, partial [Planctomycetes bacterium]|nr:hypothetical protein [Planctomycetota bacterium]
MPLDEDIAGGYGSNIGRSGGNGSFGREGGNPYTSGNLIPVAQPPNKFMQAGDIQSQAYLEGAGVESDFLRQAIESLRGYGGFDPYMQAGHGALAGLQEGSTVGGFGNRLNEIIGGDAFGGVVDERMRSLQAGLASSGLRRSGHAMNEAAAIPLDVAMGIEGMLSGRQSGLAGLGLNAAQSQGGLEQMIAQLMGGRGAVEAGGITGAAE